MKLQHWLLLSILFFLAGCSQEVLQDEAAYSPAVELRDGSELNPHLNGQAVERPIKLQSAGTLTYYSDESCPFGIRVKGNGFGSHLGRFSVEINSCLAYGEPIIAVTTVANGDRFFANYLYAEPDPDNPNYETQYYEIDGGTGRFENATGSYYLYGEVNRTTGRYNHAGEGVIVY